jgi:hypothetical protein
MLSSRDKPSSGDALFCRGEQVGDIIPAEISRIAERLETRALATTGNDDMGAGRGEDRLNVFVRWCVSRRVTISFCRNRRPAATLRSFG